MPCELRRSDSNPYVLETLFARLSKFTNQSVRKDASPRFKGLLITEGPLVVNGDIQYSGDINRINSQISTFSDSSLIINFDNPDPLSSGSLEVMRGGLLSNAYLRFTAASLQWSIYDGVTTGSLCHFANLTDSTLFSNNKFPLTLDSTTGSVVPTSTFAVPLHFQSSLTLDSGYGTCLQLGVDSLLQWKSAGNNAIPGAQLGLDVRDSTVLQLRNASLFQLVGDTQLAIPIGNRVNITKEVGNASTTVASLSGQVAGLASAAATNGVDLVLDTGASDTGSAVVLPSLLDSTVRSSFIVQGGQFIGKSLIFGPTDNAGANAPRLYSLNCPTINTTSIFGREFCIAPASASNNPILSTELNLLGRAPALRLSTSLNNTCVEWAIDSSNTTSNLTAAILAGRKRIDGTHAPLQLQIQSDFTSLQGSVSVTNDLRIGGTLTQAHGIDTNRILVFSNLYNTSNVISRQVAVSTPSAGWREVRCTIESQMDSINAQPYGFDIQVLDRSTNFQYVGDVVVHFNTVSYDSSTAYDRNVETSALAIPNSTKVRVTIVPEEPLPATTTLSLLYRIY